MKENKGSKKSGMKVALSFLLITWIILLLLLIFIFALRLKGYHNFQEWWNTVRPQGTVSTEVNLPNTDPTPTTEVAQITPAASATPIIENPTDTPTPTPTKDSEQVLREIEEKYGQTTKEYGVIDTEYYVEGIRTTFLALPATGNELLDTAIKEEANRLVALSTESLDEMEKDASNTQTALTLNYDCYHNDSFLSIVFHVTQSVTCNEEETWTTTDYAKVYRIADGEMLTGSEMFKESYFAILKERLVPYVTENYSEEFAESEFLSFETPYSSQDYEEYYIKEDKVYFLFGENTLIQTGHTAFSYEVSLKEALPFMNFALDGTPNQLRIRELDATKKMVALTFDDGPYPPVDKKLLALLEEHDARATFFVVGERLSGNYITMIQNLYEAGHEIGGHSYAHSNFLKVSHELLWQELNQTSLIIANAVGHAPDYVRMPYGAKSTYMTNMPYVMINWDIDSADWENRDRDKSYNRVIKSLHDGGIVLMHSLYPSTAEAVELLLDYLDENGYLAVTVSELLYYKGITPEPGETYSNARK